MPFMVRPKAFVKPHVIPVFTFVHVFTLVQCFLRVCKLGQSAGGKPLTSALVSDQLFHHFRVVAAFGIDGVCKPGDEKNCLKLSQEHICAVVLATIYFNSCCHCFVHTFSRSQFPLIKLYLY